jgi:hypothetical protein
MQETRAIQCSVAGENDEVAVWQAFGWSLQSSQEVTNIDNHIEFSGDYVIAHNDKEQYVKLVFARDTKMEHYDELHDLEAKYDALRYTPRKQNPSFNVFWLILFVIYIIIAVVNGNANKKIDAANAEIRSKKQALIEQATALVR